MQFYKWGDATPENALCEWQLLKKQIDKNDGCLPVIWLDDMLREQLGVLYDRLPKHFSVAAFLFLIQRAHEESSPYRNWKYRELEEEHRPDYRLGFALGETMALHGVRRQRHEDPVLNLVLTFIAIGRFVRPWRDYGLNWRFLEWLQYLTQPTQSVDMGSIAGDRTPPIFDISYRYRFFIEIDSTEPWRIVRLAIELCDASGHNLLQRGAPAPDADEDELIDEQEAQKLRQRIAEEVVQTDTLAEVEKVYAAELDCFWGATHNEQPPLHPAVQANWR